MMKKKNSIWFYPLMILGMLLIFTNSCKKDNNNSIPIPLTITDFDSNIYHTLMIGKQVWLVENLKVTHYNNGDPVPYVGVDSLWCSLSTGACCDYKNIPGNSLTYGKLYNFFTVIDPRNICPKGWHVPTDLEWTTLTTFLGSEITAGGKLKEKGTIHWQTPNNSATNQFGFTALPGGYRLCMFAYIGLDGFWWSTTPAKSYYFTAYYRHIGYSCQNVSRDSCDAVRGLSIRCLKN